MVQHQIDQYIYLLVDVLQIEMCWCSLHIVLLVFILLIAIVFPLIWVDFFYILRFVGRIQREYSG